MWKMGRLLGCVGVTAVVGCIAILGVNASLCSAVSPEVNDRIKEVFVSYVFFLPLDGSEKIPLDGI